ncbi:MAG TPA: hypothetical protein VMI92_11115 [Steroidobacteraceae bacterium]|nr:hypothetical protein [Steroidobacteraceae bacterium]
MKHPLAVALPVLLVSCVTSLARAEVEASLDLRLVHSDGRDSYMDGGLGKLRYDGDDDGVQLGRARLAWRGGIGGNWHGDIDLSAWSLHDHNAVDITEGYLEWRPVPTSAWRSNLKIGAFYPPISLEHRTSGWSNPYTIDSSALNTWVGEELRTIGVGYQLDHLGIAQGGRFDWGVNAAVFGWNDPAGVIVAWRGFSLNDRQTPLFGRIGTFAFGGPTQRVLFTEIDNRPGYHVGAYLKADDGLELRALHYDNRADPAVRKESISDYAWHTSFNTAGARWDGQHGTALIAQWMDGTTRASANELYTWDFNTWFVLAAQNFGKQRLAVRYDRFNTHQDAEYAGPDASHNPGKALTFGWTWDMREHVQLAAEWLRIDSTYNVRAMLGETPRAVEHSVQLALRLSL